MWGKEGLLLSFLTSGLDGGGFNAAAALSRREDVPISIDTRLVDYRPFG
jgi:hypothetical protein